MDNTIINPRKILFRKLCDYALKFVVILAVYMTLDQLFPNRFQNACTGLCIAYLVSCGIRCIKEKIK